MLGLLPFNLSNAVTLVFVESCPDVILSLTAFLTTGLLHLPVGMQVVLAYPDDAKEISWQNGQPVHRPYRGPSQLRFEQDFPDDYDIRLAVTSWAKAHFEVLHSGYGVDPAWAADAAAVESVEVAAEAAAGVDGDLVMPLLQHAAAAAEATEPGPLAQAPPDHITQQAVASAVTAAAQHRCHPLAEDAGSDPTPVGVAAAAASSSFAPSGPLLDALLRAPPLQRNLEAHPAAALLVGASAALELGSGSEHQRLALQPEVVDEAHAVVGARACAVPGTPALCPDPSMELFEDGHLPAPSQG